MIELEMRYRIYKSRRLRSIRRVRMYLLGLLVESLEESFVDNFTFAKAFTCKFL